jgi:hypothetical protein
MSNINQCTEFLSQGWPYWEESAMMLAKSPNIKARDNQKPLRRQRNNKRNRNRKAKARNQKTSRKEEENTQKRGGTLRGRNLEDKLGLRKPPY